MASLFIFKGTFFYGVFLAILLVGCGTIMTVAPSMRQEIKAEGAIDCTIPNIYSGTILDICAVRAGDNIGAILFFDIPLSFAADTVILPFTTYMQIQHGNITSNITKEEKDSKNNKGVK